MKCIKCCESIETETKKLFCVECSGHYHLTCVKGISDSDYDYIVSAQVNWKCSDCDRKKKARDDNTPLTPTGVSNKPYLFPQKSGSEADSDSSTTFNTGTTKKTICSICNKGFSYNSHRAVCKNCDKNFHLKCQGLSKDDFSRQASTWTCQACSGRSGLTSSELSAEQIGQGSVEIDKKTVMSSDISLIDILKEMRDFRTEFRNTNKEFSNQLEMYSQWLLEQGSKIDELGKKIEVITADITNINQENTNLKKTVGELTVKLNIVEQSNKDKDLEISGVPYKDKENLF